MRLFYLSNIRIIENKRGSIWVIIKAAISMKIPQPSVFSIIYKSIVSNEA